MIVEVNEIVSGYFLSAPMGGTPSTQSESNSYYYAFVPLTVGQAYSVELLTADIRYRVASFQSRPMSAGINGIRSFADENSNPPVGHYFEFVAEENENVLVIYGGNIYGGATGQETVEIKEIANPHNYSSVEEMINAGTRNMTVLVNNVGYDDNAYTITNIPSWLKFNGITASSILASGNTWFGINSSTEHIKFNRRDTKMYYLYREDGLIYDHFRYLKLRWRGYSVWNQTGSSYLQEWEVIFFDTGDVMLHAVTIPTTNYDGSFNIVASQTYTYTKPTAASPYVTFYTQDENNTIFDIDYKIIQLACWNDKWLIEDEGVFYNIVDGELNPLEITEITEQNMIDYGNDEIPEGSLLVSLTKPKLHHWNDSDKYLEEPIQPRIIATLTAYPYPQTMDLIVDMSHETILGINGVTAQYSGTLTVSYSLDDGETYTEEESVQDFLNEDFNALYENLPESKQLFMRFVFTENATLTNLKFTFKN